MHTFLLLSEDLTMVGKLCGFPLLYILYCATDDICVHLVAAADVVYGVVHLYCAASVTLANTHLSDVKHANV